MEIEAPGGWVDMVMVSLSSMTLGTFTDTHPPMSNDMPEAIAALFMNRFGFFEDFVLEGISMAQLAWWFRKKTVGSWDRYLVVVVINPMSQKLYIKPQNKGIVKAISLLNYSSLVGIRSIRSKSPNGFHSSRLQSLPFSYLY